MIIGKVVGSIVSTRKCENLTGSKFMIVQPVADKKEDGRIVAVGEYVLVTLGSAARVSDPTVPVDAAIVGIIDDGNNL